MLAHSCRSQQIIKLLVATVSTKTHAKYCRVQSINPTFMDTYFILCVNLLQTRFLFVVHYEKVVPRNTLIHMPWFGFKWLIFGLLTFIEIHCWEFIQRALAGATLPLGLKISCERATTTCVETSFWSNNRLITKSKIYWNIN